MLGPSSKQAGRAFPGPQNPHFPQPSSGQPDISGRKVLVIPPNNLNCRPGRSHSANPAAREGGGRPGGDGAFISSFCLRGENDSPSSRCRESTQGHFRESGPGPNSPIGSVQRRRGLASPQCRRRAITTRHFSGKIESREIASQSLNYGKLFSEPLPRSLAAGFAGCERLGRAVKVVRKETRTFLPIMSAWPKLG